MVKRKKMSYGKQLIISSGLGAGAGVLFPHLIKNYMPGTVPFLPISDPWNRNEIFYPLVAGSGMVLSGAFIDRLDPKARAFLAICGVTSIISGYLQTVNGTPARAMNYNIRRAPPRANNPGVRRPLRLNRSLVGRNIRGRSSVGQPMRKTMTKPASQSGLLSPRHDQRIKIQQTVQSPYTVSS